MVSGQFGYAIDLAVLYGVQNILQIPIAIRIYTDYIEAQRKRRKEQTMEYTAKYTLPISAIDERAYNAYKFHNKATPIDVTVNVTVGEYSDKDEFPAGYNYATDSVIYSGTQIRGHVMHATGFSFMCQGAKVSGKFAEPIHCNTYIRDERDDEVDRQIDIDEPYKMAEKIQEHCGKMNYADTGLEY